MQPAPLFTKMEASLIADCKKRFAGTQADRSPQKTVSKASPADIDRLIKEIEEQVIIHSLIIVTLLSLPSLPSPLPYSIPVYRVTKLGS